LCVARVKQLKDLMYLEEQRQQRKKVEEAKRLPWETKEQRRCEDPKTWKHYFAKVEEANIHAKAADLEGTTFETWSPPHPERGNFPPPVFKIWQFILIVVSKGLMSAFVIFFLL
jgi:hypothetical protein